MARRERASGLAHCGARHASALKIRQGRNQNSACREYFAVQHFPPKLFWAEFWAEIWRSGSLIRQIRAYKYL